MNTNQKNSFKVSVRNLIEFVLRSGNIDNRKSSVADKDAMQAGSRIHRKIQRRMGANYHTEVPLKIIIEDQAYDLIIEGRADGVILLEEQVVIDEIKGVYQDVNHLKEAVFIHKAQAMCYGYIYAKENELAQIGIQITYCNIETEEIRRFEETISFVILEHWFLDIVTAYKKWTSFQSKAKALRQESIKPLQFPFSYRAGQKELVVSVYKTINRKKNLFIQAPTGVGKTMSVVFPTVKAMGEGLGDKIFYLTAKTITRTVAQEAFEQLKRQGLVAQVVTITAKEKMCACESMDCNPVACSYALGHYDRVNDGVFDIINQEHNLNQETIIAYAKKHHVCPFEMCLDITTWADVIICDYNYVFDPNVQLKRFFSEGVKGNYLFLIDEAHNLVERGRQMYSASLYKEHFLEIKRIVKAYNPKLEKLLEKANRFLLERKRECESYEEIEHIEPFVFSLMAIMVEMDRFLQEVSLLEERKKVLELYLQIRHFLNIYERVDENYVIFTEHMEEGFFQIKLFCIQTAKNLQMCLDKGNSTVFFSATLLPIQYYKGLLSAEDENYAVYVTSPFSYKQRLLLIGKDVSSKYSRRSRNEYEKFAHYISTVIRVKKGNYMIFFPSYRFMELVYECFIDLDPKEVTCVFQSTHMDEGKREEFLKEFQEERAESLIGFCVMGGIFGEGIDLKEEALIGVFIVGTGLPQVCNEREILKRYYDEKHLNGFDYAYRYPGMNKVLQAAGRVIRTTQDKGVILLLDERFQSQAYKQLFPREWDAHDACRIDQVEQMVDQFWLEEVEK